MFIYQNEPMLENEIVFYLSKETDVRERDGSYLSKETNVRERDCLIYQKKPILEEVSLYKSNQC